MAKTFKVHRSEWDEVTLTNANINVYLKSLNVNQVLGETSCPPDARYHTFMLLNSQYHAVLEVLDKLGLEIVVKET